MSRMLCVFVTVAALFLNGCAGSSEPPTGESTGSPGAAVPASLNEQWVTAWSTSQRGLGDTRLTNATVRLMARVTAAGKSVRFRLDNTFGTTPLVIGAVSVGETMRGPRLAPGSIKPIYFDGSTKVTIPPGGSVQSDPVEMSVVAQQDLAITLYVPGADVRPSQHGGALVTSHLTANGAGDRTADESADAFKETTTSMFWLKAVDVLSTSSTGTIVAFGDSITDGSCSTNDGHDRWQDALAVRLHLAAEGGAHKAVINEGIGGNTVSADFQSSGPGSPPPTSPAGIERLDRDVLSHSGVTHVVLFMGTNDIRRKAPAAQVTAGMAELIERVHARGLKIIGVTIIPRHDRPPSANNTGWSATETAIRNEVNAWIRTEAPFDGVLDFDKVVQDPNHSDLIASAFNCDGVHPNPRGYYEMATSVSLQMFQD